jgi:hypothetical protein
MRTAITASAFAAVADVPILGRASSRRRMRDVSPVRSRRRFSGTTVPSILGGLPNIPIYCYEFLAGGEWDPE